MIIDWLNLSMQFAKVVCDRSKQFSEEAIQMLQQMFNLISDFTKKGKVTVLLFQH